MDHIYDNNECNTHSRGALAVPDPMWRIGLSFYGQICANVLCIFTFRKYLCNPKEVRLFSKKNLKYYMWAVVIGIGVCLGHRIFFLNFMGFAEQSVQDIGRTVIVDQTMFLATALGVVIGYAVILTDNIYIGVVIHVVNNSFSFVNVNFLNKFWGLSYSQTLMQVFGGCILLLFGILMLRRESGKLSCKL